MDACKTAFEAWYKMPVDADMDIATSVAWDNWRSAWAAAYAALNKDDTRELAYERTCSIWLTAATSDREKFAYRDGHDRGWRNAVEAIRLPSP